MFTLMVNEHSLLVTGMSGSNEPGLVMVRFEIVYLVFAAMLPIVIG